MAKTRILIIDDEPNMIEPVLDRLEFIYGTDKFAYTQYFNEALMELQKGDISCIYLDLIMPADKTLLHHISLINGINALKQIRETYRELPVVCYTIVKEEEMMQKIADYKAEYISKTDNDGFSKLFKFFEKCQTK